MINSLKKIKRKSIFLIIIVICLVSMSIASMKMYENKLLNTNSTLSNKKIGWGIKRQDNHEQPDVGSNNQKMLQDNNGICLGNKENKNIYLTFDMGYEAGYTETILNALKDNNVQATFFITAHYLNTAGDLVKRMIDEGHIIGNHTVNHKSMPGLSDEEIKKEVMTLHQSLFDKFGYEMKYMRPPCGEFSERTLALTNSLGYKTVMWSFAYVDWEENKQPSHEKAMSTIMNNLHNGEIMLLHATSKTNGEIMNELLQKIKDEGYEIKSLDDFTM